MKKTKISLPFWIGLTLSSVAFSPVSAAGHIAQKTDNGDSTFTIPIGQADRIHVTTSNINLTIKRWAEAKAQLVVVASTEDWNSDLLVRMRSNSGGILVEMMPKPRVGGGMHRLPSDWSEIKATLNIPDGHEFVLGSSFADVEILSDFKMGEITVNNGELTASNIPELELNAQFSKVHLNDCRTGKISLNNGELTASSISQLKLNAQFAKVHLTACQEASVTANNTTLEIGTVDMLQLGSTFSTVDLKAVNQLTLTSNNDDISIADLGEATGRKTFGRFRIGKLRKGFSLVGQNADVSFGEISPTVDTLKIDDQFAQLHIPVEGIPGFSLHFEGSFATVKSHLPRTIAGDQTELNHSEFTMNKGAGGGKFPMLNLHCNNCEVNLE